MRVAVVDIGTNSTRLLVADIADDGALAELERRTRVTRLGDRLGETGVLDDAAMERVLTTLAEYGEAMDGHGAQRSVAVLTSAVRDAANGDEFLARVRAQHDGLDARVIAGDEEARLTFRGATSERPPADATPTVVIDIGGGSTELVIGSGGAVSFHVSTQAGVVRQTERHLASDPPAPAELEELASEVLGLLTGALAGRAHPEVESGIAVAGTPTSLAAIDQGLDPYDPRRVHGHRLSLETVQHMLSELASLPLAERREIIGLHPDRAPTIVAGVVILIEAMRAFGLSEVIASEHDILHGAALEAAQARNPE
jgi:exopolyphosphatase / guanosine-5'-triphosphate,3'-diphosphate pyrophosphatase